MKKFILQIVTFIILIILLVFLIGNITISDEYVIHKTHKTSYEKIAWNLNLLNNHPEKITGSHIFLGPSLMQGGVCDSTLRAHGIKAINMGINHTGNEVELFFLERALRFKPKKIHMHLSKEKHLNLHPMTALLYTPISLLSSGQSLNVSFFDFLFKRASFVLDYFVWTFMPREVNETNYGEYGVIHEQGSFTEGEYNAITKDETDLIFEGPHLQENEFKLESEKNKDDMGVIIKRLMRVLKYIGKNIGFIFNDSSQQRFVAKAFELGKKHNVEIAELYLPVIADVKTKHDFGPEFYRSRPTMEVESIKNFSFLDHPDYWFDMNHLSRKGSLHFTETLISEHVIQPDYAKK